jgi:ribosomal protein S18 acetylase RimI-like enzyme
MSSGEIRFREGSATSGDVRAHLKACDEKFLQRLSGKVDIEEYSIKITSNAKTFEAWSGGSLVGLVAAYMNDSIGHRAFITSVSVLPDFAGRGIASRLLDRCIVEASKERMDTIVLEVSRANIEAIRLYEKRGFAKVESRDEAVVMSLSVAGIRQ